MRHGRTNPATSTALPGGVAANIARSIRQHRADMKITFIGAAATGNDDAAASLRNADIDVAFARLNGSHPSYNAILDHNGELIIGVADMALYDTVTPTDIIPLLPEHPQAVIVDANFPAETLAAIAARLSDDCCLYAAGTSAQKVHRLVPMMNRLDALVLNRAEACELVGKTGARRSTRRHTQTIEGMSQSRGSRRGVRGGLGHRILVRVLIEHDERVYSGQAILPT